MQPNWIQNGHSVHPGRMVTGTPSNLAHAFPLPLGNPREPQIRLSGMRKQVVALEVSMCGEYLLGCLREAQKRTAILKELSCS